MASTTTMTPYSNNSAMWLIPVSILGAIALCLVVLRIFTRLQRTGKLYADDWLILIAEPLSLTNMCIAAAAIASGWGKPLAYLSPGQVKATLRLQFALQTVWILTLWCVRVSICASLLRFGQERWWKWTLWSIMTLQSLIGASYVVIQFGQCRPVSWNWEQVGDVKCWDINAIVRYGWAVAGLYVAVDLVLSFMPLKLVRSLSRPTSEKILIGVLMSLGLLATAMTCAKMTTYNDFGKGDPMQATMKPSVLAKLEEVVGIIASSLPCLKSPAEQLLKRIGILKEHQLTKPSFVHTMSLPNMQREANERSGSEGSGPSGKGDVRVDSVAFKPGSSEGEVKKNWEAV